MLKFQAKCQISLGLLLQSIYEILRDFVRNNYREIITPQKTVSWKKFYSVDDSIT